MAGQDVPVTIVDKDLAALAAEIDRETSRIIEEHFNRPGSNLKHHEFISVRLYSVDGCVARFWDEGIEFYPNEDADD